MDMNPDVDPKETREWLDAIDGVLEYEGPDRAHFLIEQIIDQSRSDTAVMRERERLMPLWLVRSLF